MTEVTTIANNMLNPDITPREKKSETSRDTFALWRAAIAQHNSAYHQKKGEQKAG